MKKVLKMENGEIFKKKIFLSMNTFKSIEIIKWFGMENIKMELRMENGMWNIKDNLCIYFILKIEETVILMKVVRKVVFGSFRERINLICNLKLRKKRKRVFSWVKAQ